MKFLSVAAVLTFLQVTIAYPLYPRGVVQPDNDPFYTPKAGYESLKNGEIINWRKSPNPYGFLTLEERIESAYQILVRSEDSFGNPNAIVTTVLIPHDADFSKILSYQAAVDTPDPNCAPSYALQQGSDPSSWVSTQIEQVLSEAGLYEGWVVVVPDFLGPKAAFGVGLQAAHATLNSLRAVVNSGQFTNVQNDAKIALWGYSGGSQPTMWASALAPTYAPELNLIGTAAGGLLVDPEHIAQITMDGPFAGLIVNAINGLANEYQYLKDFIIKTFYPQIQPKFFSVDKQCLLPSVVDNLFANWNELSPLGIGILQTPEVKNATSTNNLLNLDAKPSIPFFIYNARHDEILPAADTDQLYTKWCAEGVSIEYHQDELSEHITQAIFGAGSAFTWLKNRFNGEQQSSCNKVNTISNALNFDSLLGFNDIIIDALKTLFFQEVGPNFLGGPLLSFAELPSKGNNTDASKTIVQGTSTSIAQADVEAVKSGDAQLVNAPGANI